MLGRERQEIRFVEKITQRRRRPQRLGRGVGDVKTQRRRGGEAMTESLAALPLVVLGYAGFYDLFHQSGREWLVGREANGAF
jgi:hypothetical protein